MFVDDFWLAFILASGESDVPPRLVLVNTEHSVGDPELVQTTFWFDPHKSRYTETFFLHLDQGGNEPTPEEDSFAPFYQDPSQRILTVQFFEDIYIFAVKVEVLLKLAREHGGTELEWEQWRTHVVEVPSLDSVFLWVAGPRLFSLSSIERWDDEKSWVDVYDFSPRASGQHLQEVATNDGRIVWKMDANLKWYRVPWGASLMHFVNGSYDCIVFFEVNVFAPKT